MLADFRQEEEMVAEKLRNLYKRAMASELAILKNDD